MNAPTTPRDFGNGFLMRRGYVLAWVGWGADIAPGDNRLTVNFPIAMANGQPITERILTEFGDRNFNGGNPTTLPLERWHGLQELSCGVHQQAGSRSGTMGGGKRFPAAQRSGDSARDACARRPVGFRFVPRGLARHAQRNGHLLQGRFPQRSQLPSHLSRHRFTGDGAGLRDLARLRVLPALCREGRRRQAESGRRNPAPRCARASPPAACTTAITCTSASTRTKRAGASATACTSTLPGAQRLFLNYRFAQPNPFTQQHRERYVPDVNFPVTYAIRRDPASGGKTASSSGRRPTRRSSTPIRRNEYWQFRASLLGTDPGGTADIADPPNVRRYLLSSTQHGWFKGDAPHYGIANRQCEQLDQCDSHRRDPARADRGPGGVGEERNAAARQPRAARGRRHAGRARSPRLPGDPGSDLRRSVQRLGRARFRAAGQSTTPA